MAKEKTNIEVLHIALAAMKAVRSRDWRDSNDEYLDDDPIDGQLLASIAEITALIGKARVDREVFGNALAVMTRAVGWDEHRCLYDIGFDDGYRSDSPAPAKLKPDSLAGEIMAQLATSIAELTALIGDK